METFPISDSESEGATSAAVAPAAQLARTPALKRPLSDEGEVDCITLDSDSEEEQVRKNWPRKPNPAREIVPLRNQLWIRAIRTMAQTCYFRQYYWASRELQRDVVFFLGWPIAPSYMSPNARRGGGVADSQPMSKAVRYTGAQINFVKI